MSQDELRITMLGKLQLAWGDGRLPGTFTSAISPKNRALLCYLVLNNRLHQREELATIFWPEKAYRPGLANLRVALNALRAAGLKPYLETQRPEISFNQLAHYWCDVQAFEALLGPNRHQTEPDIPGLTKAIALYQGEFLEGFSLPELPVFDDWLNQQRQRLDDLMWQALDQVIRWCMTMPVEYEPGIQYARRALELAPWRESAHQHLMWLYASTDRRAEALTQYERCREALKTWLDIDQPSPSTEELYVNIREMKSITRPSTQPLPPLPPTEPSTKAPFLVPAAPPLFFGRSEPLAQLEKLLTAVSRPARLGIVGMGGIGKTTLALHLAHTLRPYFPDGVLWANVADEQPEEIATRWATAYGFDLSRQKSGDERLAAIRRLLAEKRALLVLDDVWAGARIRYLLPEAGGSAVLITSRLERTVLSVGAEPLPLAQFSPENGRLLLRHFVDETRIEANPAAVGEICDLVGHLPLAISIAGSYLQFRPYRSLADFVVQLKRQIKPLDLTDNTQRIRETFELSWRHLDETQSRLFALLGLFAGRAFSLEAIAAIAQMDKYLVEDRLQELMQLSLLSGQEERRYRQHGLLAEFAREKLGDDPAAEVRYIAYFADFAEAQATHYGKLSPEWGNLDTAVQLASALRKWWVVLRFTAVLKDAWFARGRFEQARAAFELAFQAAVRLEAEPELAQNWLWWGQACLEQGDQDEARKWLQQALDLYDELQDGIGVADAEYELARLDIEQTLHEAAEQRLDRVLQLRQTHDDATGKAAALSRFARLRHRQHRHEEAQRLALEAVEIQQAVGDQTGHCKTLRLLVFIMIGLRQYEVASLYAEESLARAQALADLGEIAMAQKGLATVYRRLNRLAEANALAEESYTSLERMGDHQSMTAVRFLQCLIKRSEEKFAEALPLAEACLAAFRHLKDELHVVYCLIHLGDFHEKLEAAKTAVQNWQEALPVAQKLENHYLIDEINGRLARYADPSGS